MSLKLALTVALAGLAAQGCESMGTCLTPQQEGPGLEGTLAYTTGDGIRLEATLGRSWIDITGEGAVKIEGRFDDAWGRERSYELRLEGLSPGTLDLAGRGVICMPRQSGGESICSELAGTVEVRQLSYDCYSHESGISACAETIDLTLHATSAWQGTMFLIDAEELTMGAWVEEDC